MARNRHAVHAQTTYTMELHIRAPYQPTALPYKYFRLGRAVNRPLLNFEISFYSFSGRISLHHSVQSRKLAELQENAVDSFEHVTFALSGSRFRCQSFEHP